MVSWQTNSCIQRSCNRFVCSNCRMLFLQKCSDVIVQRLANCKYYSAYVFTSVSLFSKFQGVKVSVSIITARKRLGQGNIFIGVCQEFCSQGGVASVHDHDPPPPRANPSPREQTAQEQTPPVADTPRAVHAGRYSQQAGGMHPTGIQSCKFIYFNCDWFPF